MRDVKFRGQSINTVGGGKPIKEWVYGCLVIDESRKITISIEFSQKKETNSMLHLLFLKQLVNTPG